MTRTVSNPAYAYTDRDDGVVATPVNGLNQVASEDGTPFAYDARANLTGDGVRTQSFNPRNQLTAATVPATSLSYDPLGRLYGLSQSGENVRFQYDGLMPIAEYASDDTTLLRRHVPGPGLDEGLLTYEGTGNAAPSWTLADERGSVVGRADNAGVSTRTLTYDEYGVPGVGNGTGAADRFQYTGQVRLPGGLYHYRARAYDPSLGRFLQTDPMGYGAGMNLYAYVGGDPVNWSDPLGLRPCDAGPRAPDEIDPVGICAKKKPKILGGGLNSAILGSGSPGSFYGEATQIDDVVVTGPKPSPNFISPTNPPQAPPSQDSLPPGWSVRRMPPTEQYRNGYWQIRNQYNQPIDPSTMRPPSNVTSAQSRAMTHVPLPEQTRPFNPGSAILSIISRLGPVGIGAAYILRPTPAY